MAQLVATRATTGETAQSPGKTPAVLAHGSLRFPNAFGMAAHDSGSKDRAHCREIWGLPHERGAGRRASPVAALS